MSLVRLVALVITVLFLGLWNSSRAAEQPKVKQLSAEERFLSAFDPRLRSLVIHPERFEALDEPDAFVSKPAYEKVRNLSIGRAYAILPSIFPDAEPKKPRDFAILPSDHRVFVRFNGPAVDVVGWTPLIEPSQTDFDAAIVLSATPKIEGKSALTDLWRSRSIRTAVAIGRRKEKWGSQEVVVNISKASEWNDWIAQILKHSLGVKLTDVTSIERSAHSLDAIGELESVAGRHRIKISVSEVSICVRIGLYADGQKRGPTSPSRELLINVFATPKIRNFDWPPQD